MPGEKPNEPMRPTRKDGAPPPPGQVVMNVSDFFEMSISPAANKPKPRVGLPKKIGQYVVLRELGRGGMGVVYLAQQPSLNREVALKVLNINLMADPEDAARFQSEAEMAASLRHPNIVQIYEIGEQDGFAFMAMEYVEGGSLGGYLENKKMGAREAVELLEPVARAMHYAHQKDIIHRDLKPGNILLSASSEANSSRVAKITDFGLGKQMNASMHLTATGVALGTPSYMAPEQARDDRKLIGPISDVYALGAILYEMLTGRPPFAGKTPVITMQQVVRAKPIPPSQIVENVPRELEKICLKCLEKKTTSRYPNAEVLADALRSYLEGPIVEAIEPPKTRWPYVAAAVGLILAILAGTFGFVQWRQARTAKENLDRDASKIRQLEEQVRELQTGPIASVAVSPDRKMFVTASHDGTVRFWDAATGHPLGTPIRHPDAVVSVVFWSDGKGITVSCRDGTIHSWPMPVVPQGK